MSRRRAKHVAGYSICLLVPLMGMSALLMGSDAGERKPAKDAKTPVCKALKQAVMPVTADGDVDPQGQTVSMAKQPSPASEAGGCQKQACCKVDNPQPLNGTSIAAWRERIAKADDFDDRLQQRRELMYRCYREGLSYEAHAELEALLSDVAGELGPQQAHDMAWRQISEQISRGWHRAALRTIALVDDRYREGPHSEAIQLQQALCLIEVEQLDEALVDLQMLADIAEAKDVRGQALRKLALVQMLQCDHDDALTTLERLHRDFAGTPLSEYAQMRRGFVLGMADRRDEAIQQYESFLKAHPGSRYSRVALRHLNGLQAVQVATAP